VTLHRAVAVGGSLILGGLIAVPVFAALLAASMLIGPAFVAVQNAHGTLAAAAAVSGVLAAGVWAWLMAKLIAVSWNKPQPQLDVD